MSLLLKTRTLVREVSGDLVEIERRLREAGLHSSAKAIHDAAKTIAWDAVNIMEKRSRTRLAKAQP